MATSMKMFWGVVLEPGKQYAQKADTSFHLTMAAIEPSTKAPAPNKTPITSVLLESNKTKFILCNLDQQNHIQQQLDFVFVEGEEIVFSVNGDSKVHLTGYIMPESDLDDDGMYDESDVDSEEEAVTTVNAKGKKRKDMEEAKGNKKVKFGGDQAANNNKQDKNNVKPILKPNQPQPAKQEPRRKDPANLDNSNDHADDDSDSDSDDDDSDDMSDEEEFGSDDLADLLDGFDKQHDLDIGRDDDDDDDSSSDSDDDDDDDDDDDSSEDEPVALRQQKTNEKPQQKPKGTPKPQGKPQQQNSTPKGQFQQKPFQNQNQGKKSPNNSPGKPNHFNQNKQGGGKQSGGKQKFNQNQTPGKKGGTPFGNKSFGSAGKKKSWQK